MSAACKALHTMGNFYYGNEGGPDMMQEGEGGEEADTAAAVVACD